MKKLIVLLIIIVILSCCCSGSAYVPTACAGKWLLLSPGRKTTPVRIIPEEHGQLVAVGHNWLVIYEPDTGEAVVRNGDETFYGTVTQGQQPEGDYCGALHLFLHTQFWVEDLYYYGSDKGL